MIVWKQGEPIQEENTVGLYVYNCDCCGHTVSFSRKDNEWKNVRSYSDGAGLIKCSNCGKISALVNNVEIYFVKYPSRNHIAYIPRASIMKIVNEMREEKINQPEVEIESLPYTEPIISEFSIKNWLKGLFNRNYS